MSYYKIKNSELYHHGILGQKWGVRRYQNEDGTLTELGKKRKSQIDRAFTDSIKNGKDRPNVSPVQKTISETSNINAILKNRALYSRKQEIESIDLSSMSDAELRASINRMLLEKQYKDLKEKEIKTGYDKVANVLDHAGDVLAVASSAVTIRVMMKKVIG